MRRVRDCKSCLAGGAPCDFRVMPAGSERLAYWLGGTRSTKPDDYRNASPANFITADDPPMFFFHGDRRCAGADRQPATNGRAAQAAGVTAEMYTVQRAGHIQALLIATRWNTRWRLRISI